MSTMLPFAKVWQTPYWSCQYGIISDPRFHDCDNCADSWWCEQGYLRRGMLDLIKTQDEINAQIDEWNAELSGEPLTHVNVIPDEWRYL